MSGIFISYRREDSAPYAGRLFDRLCSHFGADDVFIDVDTIEPGEDFVHVLEQRMDACEAMVVLIGKSWASAVDSNGRPRLRDRNDVVRTEIGVALTRDIRVFPVLLDGASTPRRQDVPAALVSLLRRQFLEISHARFHQDVDRLIGLLEKAVPAVRGRQLRTLTGHSENVLALAVSADGRRAVSGSADKTVKTWDLEAGRELNSWPQSEIVEAVSITPDGTRAISSCKNTVKVWNLTTGQRICTLAAFNEKLQAHARYPKMAGHSSPVTRVALSAGGERAVSVSEHPTKVKVWDVRTAKVLHTLEVRWDHVAAISADGWQVVSSSWEDNQLTLWDVPTSRALHTLKGHADLVIDVSLTRDQRRAVSASRDKTLKVWDLETGHELRTLYGHSAPVTRVFVVPDGLCAVSASADETLRAWDLETGQQLRKLKGVKTSVLCAGSGPDGLRVVSTSGDKTISLWLLDRIATENAQANQPGSRARKGRPHP